MFAEVIAFAVIMTAFEFVIIAMMPPRTRLRVLGSSRKTLMIHFGMLSINLMVHWGTIVGTMSSTLSFLTSIAATALACQLFGKIIDDRYYTVGIVKYSKEELK